MAMMFAWTLNAQVDTIVTASGELGNSGSDLEFLNESGELTRFPRLSDAGELLYYPPLVTTDSVTNITSTSATVYGNILFNGWYENVQEQGFQLSTTADFSGSVTTQAISPENPYADCDLPCVENVYSFIFTELTPTTTYYVRAYATNEEGMVYGDTLQFATPLGCGISTVQDYDGNVYNTVQIGSQCWTKENLKTTHYTNGTAIPLGSTTSTTVAYRYNPNNDAANVATYGCLYNWPAVMNGETPSNAIPSGVQGICPDGWHVPSDREWQEMEFAVGMSASDTVRQQFRGNIVARLCGNTGWSSSSVANAAGNISAENRNSTDFNACPAGYYNAGSSTGFGQEAEYWTATMYNSDSSFRRDCIYTNVGINRTAFNKNRGFSVRCVHDTPVSLGELPIVTTNIVTDITYTTATCGGNVVYEGSSAVTVRGVCWSTSANPTVRDSHTEDGSGQGSFISALTNLIAGTTYYVRAYAINSADTAYGEEVSFTSFACGISTITDYDGNVYNTVQIGGQCWMKENLKTTHYADGTTMSQGFGMSNTVAYWGYPNQSSSNKNTYGLLYNMKAVMRNSSASTANPSGVQGICPNGWHVPSDEEWKQMEMAVGMSQSDADNTGYRGSIAARLCGNTGWRSSTNANAAGNQSASDRNSSGFSALPAGGCSFSYVQNPDYYGGYYQPSVSNIGAYARFWSSSTTSRCLSWNEARVNRYSYNSQYFQSVRCVKD